MTIVIHAATFTQGDFDYQTLTDSTCMLTGLSTAGASKTTLKIPGYTFNASDQKNYQVQYIASQAFRGNTNITEVRIGPGVETIYGYVFQNCTNLKVVSLPSTVTSIGNYVFYSCPITRIDCAAETMPTFATYTFSNMASVSTTRIWYEGTSAGVTAANANSTITGYFTVSKNVATAYDVAGYLGSTSPNYRCYTYAIVTKLRTQASYRGECKIIYAIPQSNNTTATLEVPYNTSLDDSYSVYYPVEIADYAFQNNSTIKKLLISGVSDFQRIGNYAFLNCTSLTSVTLSAKAVGNFAFDGCTNLTSVKLYGNNEDYYSVQSLGYASFRGTAVSSVYIPKGLTSYQGGPFCGCPNLTEFTVSNSNTTFAAYNYSLYSKDYTTLYQYPSGRNAFYFDEQCHQSMTRINGYAFKGNTKTSFLYVPYGVTNIGAEAFYGMTALQTLRIPSSVTTFVHNTFQGMSGLKNFYFNRKTIPSTLTGSNAFYNIKSGCVLHVPRTCASLYSSTSPWSTAFTGGIQENSYDYLATINNGSALDYYMGYTVTSTASYTDAMVQTAAVNGQMSLVYCETAHEGGFQGSITIPSTVTLRGKTYMVTEVEREVCRSDPRIKYIYGGAAVKKIGALAFAGLTATSYGACYIPNPVEMGDSCFMNSTMSTIKLGTRLQRIGHDAFALDQHYRTHHAQHRDRDRLAFRCRCHEARHAAPVTGHHRDSLSGSGRRQCSLHRPPLRCEDHQVLRLCERRVLDWRQHGQCGERL